jgi:hypothetical protein
MASLVRPAAVAATSLREDDRQQILPSFLDSPGIMEHDEKRGTFCPALRLGHRTSSTAF